MTQEVLLRREKLVRGATPVPAPADLDLGTIEAKSEFRPGLRSFELHGAVYAVMIGALAWFFLAYAITFAGGTGMPLVLTICVFYGAMYFGGATVFEKVKTGDRKVKQSFAAFRHNGIATASGHLSGMGAFWQVTTLPLSLAGFATFVLIYFSV